MNNEDIRVIKTKKALTDSLYFLLEEEVYSTITVNKICENANVHRTTFYKHFYDKKEILVYLFKLTGDDYFSTDIKERINNPFQVLAKSFNKEELFRIEMKQQDDKEFKKIYNDYLIEIVQNDFKNNMHCLEVDHTVPKSLISYVFGSVLAAFIEWKMNEHATINSQHMDQIFHKLLNVKARE
ncbi:TetR/AcrR family transcriptional regulator [Staphylococcus devriesei]|uniref:TetR family transcriptional regulator n=1 Tax=Staphylococcus devriesei TaxID=586733 RepID=A0A2T4KIF0_9STAP|nr:TetR/AcrR family transcriptional regulator [Staphylococcus devriesei]PTE73674.1 TetR family transcriptional regulator [Staphylococcus devriesei]PTF02613.1 TetR family transcriptional regulator [Staphylococcus devriesei]PTF16777.1 TetR family transcriptional regulator [Staphylococcus devriesei]RIL75760.1 TetR/AcrR family transcriptional regulator [Staphylococcus devriesei]WKU14323.1 TetR/AcrR family transcriptional regulator [Staphylococcus devriesei]